MKNMSRFITLSLAVVLSLFLVSCEEDSVSSPAPEITPVTLADVITYNEDGSFSGTITSDQMAYILESEFSQVPSDDLEERSRAFTKLVIDNVPRKGKPGSDQEKSITYGISAQVNILTTNFDLIVDLEGIGGLESGDGPITVSADGLRRQNLTINMSAFCYVFSSEGDESLFFRNDSNGDIGTCPGKSFERFLKGEAEVTFNDVGDYEGFAIVKCSRGLVAEAPQQIREN